MYSKINCLIFLFVTFALIEEISSKFEFTNIKCQSLDKNMSRVEYCYLKSVNRTTKFMLLKVNLLQIPITNVKINAILYKRFSGYRPFMYNLTFDACRFLQNPKSNLALDYVYDFFRHNSNMNHTCPYDHDVQMKVPISFVNMQVTKVLPMPEGDYMLESHWMVNKLERFMTKIYGTIS